MFDAIYIHRRLTKCNISISFLCQLSHMLQVSRTSFTRPSSWLSLRSKFSPLLFLAHFIILLGIGCAVERCDLRDFKFSRPRVPRWRVLCTVAPCSAVQVHPRLRGAHCLQYHDDMQAAPYEFEIRGPIGPDKVRLLFSLTFVVQWYSMRWTTARPMRQNLSLDSCSRTDGFSVVTLAASASLMYYFAFSLSLFLKDDAI
jgi:hypothetical protein